MTPLVVFTIGHSTRAIEDFIRLLNAHRVQRVIDVRTIPRSRHNPQFHRDQLSLALHRARIHYRYMPGLGGLRRARPDSINVAWRNASFRGYADYMQTPTFRKSLDRCIALAKRDGLDPIPWTSSERWIRCPEWRSSRAAGEPAGSSLTSSRTGAVRLVLDEGKTVGAVARELDLTASALGLWVRARARRADEGQERADEGRARGADAAAQRESRAADGARHPKKSRGLLREGPAVAFAWIDAERASIPGAHALSDVRRVAERVLRLAHATGVDTGAGRPAAEGPGARVVHRRPRRTTAARAIHDDFVEWQERVSRKRVIRLMQEDGLKARVRKRYKGTTMSDHDQPVAANLLQQAVHGRAAESALGRRHDASSSSARAAKLYLAVDPRPVLAVRRRLGGQRRQRSAPDHQSARHGAEATLPGGRPAPSLRPGLHVRQRGLPERSSRRTASPAA